MRNLLIPVVASAMCGLAGCGQKTPPPVQPAAVLPPTIGIDPAGVDHGVAPGDDFDAYANGGWRAVTEIPADRSSTGTFLKVIQLAEQRQQQLVQGIAAGKPAPGSDDARIADYYAAFMDVAGIEARGTAPVKAQLDAIAAIADKSALSAELVLLYVPMSIR